MSNVHQEALRKRLSYLKVQELSYTCLAGGGEKQEEEEINPAFLLLAFIIKPLQIYTIQKT